MYGMRVLEVSPLIIVTGIMCPPNGKYIASPNCIIVGDRVWPLEGQRIAVAALNSGDDTKCEVAIWDVDAGTNIATLDAVQAEWSPNSQYLVSIFDNTVQIWEAATGKQITTYKGRAVFDWS